MCQRGVVTPCKSLVPCKCSRPSRRLNYSRHLVPHSLAAVLLKLSEACLRSEWKSRDVGIDSRPASRHTKHQILSEIYKIHHGRRRSKQALKITTETSHRRRGIVTLYSCRCVYLKTVLSIYKIINDESFERSPSSC